MKLVNAASFIYHQHTVTATKLTKLSLSDRWGTCFTSHDGGFSSEMIFQHKLNPQKGLFLEIYADASNEKVGIKYIEVSIVRESWLKGHA